MIAHILGLDNANGPFYLFYNGVGADLTELTIVGALFGWWAKHTCHVHRCCRLARRAYDGHVLCNRHHPIDPPTAESLNTDAATH